MENEPPVLKEIPPPCLNKIPKMGNPDGIQKYLFIANVPGAKFAVCVVCDIILITYIVDLSYHCNPFYEPEMPIPSTFVFHSFLLSYN